MPPSSASLDSFGLLAHEHRGTDPLSASLGRLCNALIDFSLGITHDTSTLARVKKRELTHLSR